MLKLWLIRHGQTYGNSLKRYIGVTDEPLSDEGRRQLEDKVYPRPDMVFVSTLRRCVETAQILFPQSRLQMIGDLEECDFGEFENKNYLELSDDPRYQAWIDSDGTLPFPGGESREECQKRQLRGFEKGIERCIKADVSHAAFVIHEGTIRNIMEAYAIPHRPFYEWKVRNGEAYILKLDPESWKENKKELYLLEKEGKTYETAMDSKRFEAAGKDCIS